MDAAIAVLPSTVIDQIAAGEVIERPASVVKELLDNALDAGARTVSIEVSAGGRTLVRVVDDGRGMSPRDAVVAFERHATSKLRAAEDLWGLATMGFRGEALPAIASVARVTLTTRRIGDLAATRVRFAGGRLEGVDEVGAPVGTTVEVAELFANVPARLKFLKAEATEASHVTELVARVAFAHPELHLRLRHNGRTALDVPPDRDGLARVQALLGPRTAARIVAATGEEAGVRTAAYLASPELSQTTARSVQLFVGRRPVRDRGLLHAVTMGYGELIPRGRYPVAIVMIDVPAGCVDLNVHPQKHEVRFTDGAAVAAAVRHVVQNGVARAPWRDEVGGGVVMMTAIGVAPPALPLDGGATPMAQRYAAQLREAREREWVRGTAQAQLGLDDGARAWVDRIKTHVRAASARDAELAARMAYAVKQPEPARAHEAVPRDEAALAEGSAPAASAGYFGSLRYLGQLDLTYLVCEGEGELVLIDQHVAHEHVELARLERQGEREVATQRMLFPTTIELGPELVGIAEQMTAVLAQVGFEAEAFGKGALAVRAVPASIRHTDPAQLLRGLLGQWGQDGVPSEAERLGRVLAEIACHSVVRAGDRLSTGEAEALLRALDTVDVSGRGPHGRPVLLRLPLGEIARRFGR